MTTGLLQSLVELREEQPGDEYFRPVAGALIGAAAADALGWITEFVRGREHLRKLYGTDRVDRYRAWQKKSGGRFNTYVDYINRGEYSDDTQLTLAVARSLLPNGTVDVQHFAKIELPLWLQYARGAGATITAAAKAASRKSAKWNTNFFNYRRGDRSFSYRDAGANGAAMRIGPIALANLRDSGVTYDGVWRTSIVTHGHPRAIFGAVLHAEALRLCAVGAALRPDEFLGALRAFVSGATVPGDPDYQSWLALWNKGAARPFHAVWEETRAELLEGLDLIAHAKGAGSISTGMATLGCFDRATKGSGTATVLAGLLIFVILGTDFQEAVVTAINQLGADTDTIGSFVGGLCGACHGYENVPPQWATELQDYDYLVRVATELSRVAARAGMGGRAVLPQRGRPLEGTPDLLEQLERREISKGDRVYHPLFGTGWVDAMDAQALRRRDGSEAVFAYVRFDIGQSCKFRFIRMPKARRAATQTSL
jgi:ADP-ribosylglycohydrolase